jgi:hypothetical protein
MNMQDFGSAFNKPGVVWVAALMLLIGGCQFSRETTEPARAIQLHQHWELQPGDRVAGHSIVGGLGDVSIGIQGDRLFAPFDGLVQPDAGMPDCVIFSSTEIPAYLFRLCGLRQTRLGKRSQGDPIGSGDYLHFATLRRQPDGTWAMVEPSRNILEKILTPP